MNKFLTIDSVTFWIFFGFWPIWIIWELVLLKLRGGNTSVDLISMVARDRAYQMASIAFAWGSLAAHFFANWRELPPWYGIVPSLSFWILLAAVLVWDIFLWNTPYAQLSGWIRFVRFPGTMLFLGLLNGFLLFPQKGNPFQPL